MAAYAPAALLTVTLSTIGGVRLRSASTTGTPRSVRDARLVAEPTGVRITPPTFSATASSRYDAFFGQVLFGIAQDQGVTGGICDVFDPSDHVREKGVAHVRNDQGPNTALSCTKGPGYSAGTVVELFDGPPDGFG